MITKHLRIYESVYDKTLIRIFVVIRNLSLLIKIHSLNET